MSGVAASRARKNREHAWIRYAFYAGLLILVALIIILPFLYLHGTISMAFGVALSSVALSLIFPISVFSYLLAKGRRLRDMVSDLGLSRKGITARNVLTGMALFVFAMVFGMALQEFSQLMGVPLPTNVEDLLSGMPVYFLVFSFLVSPLNEEILFRGFLVPRIGIVLSAVVFAVPHLLTYSSVAELAAAFVFGLASGYVFRRTRSLYPGIMAHALVNFLTIIAFLH